MQISRLKTDETFNRWTQAFSQLNFKLYLSLDQSLRNLYKARKKFFNLSFVLCRENLLYMFFPFLIWPISPLFRLFVFANNLQLKCWLQGDSNLDHRNIREPSRLLDHHHSPTNCVFPLLSLICYCVLLDHNKWWLLTTTVGIFQLKTLKIK